MAEYPTTSINIDCAQLLQHTLISSSEHETQAAIPLLAMMQLPLETPGCSTDARTNDKQSQPSAKIVHIASKPEKIPNSSRFLGSRRHRNSKQIPTTTLQTDTIHSKLQRDPNTLITNESSVNAKTIPSTSGRESYLLVANTPFAIVAQLVGVNSSQRKQIDLPDPSSISNPFLVWKHDANLQEDDFLNTPSTILIQEPRDTSSTVEKTVCLHLAIVVGTNHGRVLSFQLNILLGHQEGQYKLCSPNMDPGTFIEPLWDLSSYQQDHDVVHTVHTHNTIAHHTTLEQHAKKRNRSYPPFQNSGGVTSIQAYYIHPSASSVVSSPNTRILQSSIYARCFVWITFTDGTMVRVFHEIFFSTVQSPIPNQAPVKREIYVLHPYGPKNQIFIPFPRSFPTVLSPSFDIDASAYSFSDDESQILDMEEYDFIQCRHPVFEALSFSKDDVQGDYPTLSFYSSENTITSDLTFQESIQDNTISPTSRENDDSLFSIMKTTSSSLAKGVFGGFMGTFLKNTSTTSDSSVSEPKKDNAIQNEMDFDMEDNVTNESHVNYQSLHLPFTRAIFDIPRKITSLTIDPVSADLAACTDNLGRVQLIDLNTKQVVRLWKGMRDASCHWMTHKGETHLVIHARQRNVIEIYRMRHGLREDMIPMQTTDNHIVQCHILGSSEEIQVKCFLFSLSHQSVESVVISTRDTTPETHSTGISPISEVSSNPTLDSGSSIPLRLLQQLISSEFEGSLSSDSNAVLDAFKQVTVIHDLTRAIDILAKASSFEERMGVKGTSFHRNVISHAHMIFNQMKVNDVIYTTANAHLLSELSLKLQIHRQIIAAYDIINQYQNRYTKDKLMGTNLPFDSKDDEAQSWIHTFEKVTGSSIDYLLPFEDETPEIKFFSFARCCLQSNHGRKCALTDDETVKIYFCDSSKERKKTLLHIFRPLIMDRFTIKPVREVFELLGLYHDRETLLQYFGEWITCLKLHESNVKHMFGNGSSIVGFLETVIEEDLSKLIKSNAADTPTLLLASLRSFCSSCDDLPRAFILANTCLKAVTSGTRQIEEKSYGLVHQNDCVHVWENLMNKLRISLLISLRMSCAPPTSFPMTVDNIEDGTIFSVFEWVARDELRISHRQEDLLQLEKISESIKDTDNKNNWKGMQQSCMEESSRLSPLLYFLRHYNEKHLLAAHRALILSSTWSRKPEQIQLLVNAINAIKILDSGKSNGKQLSILLRAEIWQTLLRPLYRAIFYGFDQVYELNEDNLSHLLLDRCWTQEVFRISLDLLKMLEKCDKRAESFNVSDFTDQTNNHDNHWPPLKGDIVLQGLIKKWSGLHFKSIPEHRGVICSLQLTNDIERIKSCFPEVEHLFLCSSHLIKPTIGSECNDTGDRKRNFIIEGLRKKAEASDFGLDEVMYLGNLYGLSRDFIFTTFILFMYELVKDDQVEDLVSASVRLLNVPLFLNGSIDVISLRLSVILTIMKKEKRYRSILSSLDADTCQFVHELSEKSTLVRPIILEEDIIAALHSSNSLALRVMRLSTNIRNGEMHSLSILIGTLLQTLNMTHYHEN